MDQDFEYNDIGNITRMAGKGGYTYHATKPHAVVQVSNLRYSYDDNGNVTMKSNSASTNGWKRKIKWNEDNMALAISNEMGYIVNYEYDYSGTRVKKMYSAGNSYKYINAYYQKRSDGLVMKHVFDGMSRIVTEQLDAGGTSRFWYHQNYVGSSVQITGSDGTVAQKNDFTPFGETAVSVTSSDTNFSDVTNIQYRYTGQEFDPETGFYNYNARLYDPEIGRFLSADSIVPDPFDVQSFNRYSYVLNNPIRYNDPTGHDNQPPDGAGGSYWPAYAKYQYYPSGPSDPGYQPPPIVWTPDPVPDQGIVNPPPKFPETEEEWDKIVKDTGLDDITRMDAYWERQKIREKKKRENTLTERDNKKDPGSTKKDSKNIDEALSIVGDAATAAIGKAGKDLAASGSMGKISVLMQIGSKAFGFLGFFIGPSDLNPDN